MASLPISPPPSGGNKTFSDATRNLPNGGAIVTFQQIDKPRPASKDNTTTGSAPTSKVGTIGLSVLMQKCGISGDTGIKDVSMAKIKEGMYNIGLAKEFDIWSSPNSKLLDYDLSFLEYLDQVSQLARAPELCMQVYYGLRKDHDQQTVQDVYKSGNFVIKLIQIKSGKPQGVGSIRVMETLPDGTNSGDVDLERLRSQTLGGFRERIATMSQLISKHQFCLPDETPVPDTMLFKDYVDLLDETCPYESNVPAINLRFREIASPFVGGDKAKAALSALGINHQIQKDEVPAGLTSLALGAYSDKPQASLVTQEMLKVEMSQNASSPSSLDELQWSLVMKNCQVMHGWYTDTATNQIKMAPKPAFTLRPGLNLDYTPSRGGNGVSGISIADAIPNYGVTDGSKIDVVFVESDMRNSLVRNHFEKSSMDSKISMGYSGLGIAMGTGTNSEAQNSQSSERNKSAKRMIGKYMLPRVTLFLNADDLVPTREFADNVERIRKTKDVAEIRKFQRKFGQLFCHEVTLGGMLVSTKTLTDDELVEQDKKRDTFKHAIGLTVSSPVEVGADSKKETARGSDQNLDRSYKDSGDCVVFEAVGGNTILASK
ncbi:hypothetical protein CI238_00125 [Colletotrichum incanum]|uniref:MACPF domain-containing protein n=1 Tax=Colletotrichum incanum TaxID=1573173 RepID=A0A161WAE6_COLIC|nr:hypothetical protein CI238_00125 [Colletotrichum incanum]